MSRTAFKTVIAATAFSIIAGVAGSAFAAPVSSGSRDGARSTATVIQVHDTRRGDHRGGYRHHRRDRYLDRGDVVRILHRHGYRHIRRIHRVGWTYRAVAQTRRGHVEAIVVDARRGRILEKKRMGWHHGPHRL